MRALVCVILAACSTPAPKQEPIKAPPPNDDEQSSVDWQAKQPKPDAGSGWTFDWERVRASYDKLMAEPIGTKPCDWRLPRPPRDVECLPPKRPWQHAANVRGVKGLGDAGSQLELDIGEADKLTKDWWGAVIDSNGQPISAWAHPDNIAKNRSFLIVNLPFAIAEGKKRVALVLDKPPP